MLALFSARYNGLFTSVGEILRRECMIQVGSVCQSRSILCMCTLMQYEPCSPLTLDLPVPRELEPGCGGVLQVMPVKTYVKSHVYNQDLLPNAYGGVDVEPVSSKDDIASSMSEHATCDGSMSELATDDGSCITEQAPDAEVHCSPINAHQDFAAGFPMTPPFEDLPSDSDPKDAEDCFHSPPLLVTETRRRSHVSTPTPTEEVAVVKEFPQQESVSQEDEQVDQVASELDALDLVASPVSKEDAGSGGSKSGTGCHNKPGVGSDTESSGSTLSDNDWLDEDLLPRR